MQRLYRDLAPWWSVLTPPGTYSGEAEAFLALLRQAAGGVSSLLELGSGIGAIAECLPERLEVVLADSSEEMLAQSRLRNPGREHVLSDMRSMRLGRQFDAVLLHDAVMYMSTPECLASAVATAASHLREGGGLLLVPDVVEEGFFEHAVSGGATEGSRSVQLLEWHWDPVQGDGSYRAEFSLLLREGGVVQAVHESHVLGLHSAEAYAAALSAAGFKLVAPRLDDVHWESGELFLGRLERARS